MKDQKFYIIRTYSAGVFFANIESRKDKEVVMTNARRLWYWEGAASLSQLAQEGVNRPDKCKFPCPVDRVLVTEAIEVLDCTEAAVQSIQKVPIWKV